jgi:hypothetical protein
MTIVKVFRFKQTKALNSTKISIETNVRSLVLIHRKTTQRKTKEIV